MIDFRKMKNPIYSREDWCTKDVTVAEHNGWFYLFFSALYWDGGYERCHVSGVKTKDFVTFSEPPFIWDGREDGWLGMASPNLTIAEGRYLLTYNSWGDKPGKPNQLFYAVSSDMENWDKDRPIAVNMTEGKRVIDIAIAEQSGAVRSTDIGRRLEKRGSVGMRMRSSSE